jgi:hypothetical protein
MESIRVQFRSHSIQCQMSTRNHSEPTAFVHHHKSQAHKSMLLPIAPLTKSINTQRYLQPGHFTTYLSQLIILTMGQDQSKWIYDTTPRQTCRACRLSLHQCHGTTVDDAVFPQSPRLHGLPGLVLRGAQGNVYAETHRPGMRNCQLQVQWYMRQDGPPEQKYSIMMMGDSKKRNICSVM